MTIMNINTPTVRIDPTTTSSRVSLGTGTGANLIIKNDGTGTVYLAVGDVNVTVVGLTASGQSGVCTPVLAGEICTMQRINPQLQTHIAAISESGTNKVYIQVGDGE